MIFPCHDCGVDTINETFMVEDEIWESAADGFLDSDLCIMCLERRIGRVLEKSDFTDYPINDLSIDWVRTERLIDRLSH